MVGVDVNQTAMDLANSGTERSRVKITCRNCFPSSGLRMAMMAYYHRRHPESWIWNSYKRIHRVHDNLNS